MLNDSDMMAHFYFDGNIKVLNAIFVPQRIEGLFFQPKSLGAVYTGDISVDRPTGMNTVRI
jgi:hypothetical protein